MLWFDTHCHLDLIPDCPDKIMADAVRVGVNRIVVPGVKGWPGEPETLRGLSAVDLAWGVHPMFIDEYSGSIGENDFITSTHKPIAIGECGLDRRSKHEIKEQLRIFEWQLELATSLGLPVIIHMVGHPKLTFDLVKKHKTKAVIHSCSCSTEMALRFVSIGCKISLSALHLTTDKKRQLCRELPNDAILIETDAPDFKPEGWHMKHNHPAALPSIARELAQERSMDMEKFSELVYRNSVDFFDL